MMNMIAMKKNSIRNRITSAVQNFMQDRKGEGYLDVAMKILINRMITTRINKGAVSAKISIDLKEFVNDNGEVIRMPDISYSVGMGMSEKDSMKGNMQKGLQLRRNSNDQLLTVRIRSALTS